MFEPYPPGFIVVSFMQSFAALLMATDFEVDEPVASVVSFIGAEILFAYIALCNPAIL